MFSCLAYLAPSFLYFGGDGQEMERVFLLSYHQSEISCIPAQKCNTTGVGVARMK